MSTGQLNHLRQRAKSRMHVQEFAVGERVTHSTEGEGIVVDYDRLTGLGAVNERPYRVHFHRLAGYALVWCAAEDLTLFR